MSKVSFRARQIDFNKPLPIIKNENELLSELCENSMVNRGVPQIPSGMEKEEENEHHFVEVIQALQLHSAASVKKIPVPDIIDCSLSYKSTYPHEYNLPKQLVHIRTIVLAEEDPVEYDMDTDDEEWLEKSHLPISPGLFEMMIDKLERGCGQKVMNLEEAKSLLQDDPSLVIAVYDYWLNKRVQSRQPLLFSVRQERRDGNSNSDPYVAFRRRSEKMQTRKNRKNDEQSYEKMLTLRDQMELLGEVLSRIVKRESVKEAIVQNACRCFDTRFKMRDWDGTILAETEAVVRRVQYLSENGAPSVNMKEPIRKRTSRKRNLTRRALNLSNPTNSSDEASDTERSTGDGGPFAFIRVPGCRYLKPRDVDSSHGDWKKYTLSTVPSVRHPNRHLYTGYIRRRRGRGGRVMCDRITLPRHVSEFLGSHDEAVQMYATPSERTAEKASRCTTTTISSPLPHLPMAKDEVLFRRLKTLILSTSRGRASYAWPLCTKSHSPTFEPLSPDPLTLMTADSPSPAVPPSASNYVSPVHRRQTSKQSTLLFPDHTSRVVSDGGDTDHSLLDNQPTIGSNDRGPLSLRTKRNFSLTVPSSHDLSNINSSVVDCDGATIPNHSRLTWDQSNGSPCKTSNVARSAVGSVTSGGSPAKLVRRQLRTVDDRLRLSEPSVLSPPKVRFLTRDCVSRDANVSGPQMPTTNGVNRTPFFQLPT